MGLFESISNSGKKFQNEVHTFTGNAQLTSEKNKINAEINEIYTKIGDTLYKAYKAGKDMPDYIEEFNKLDELNKRLQEIETERDTLLNSIPCSKCGTFFPKESRFCPNCGSVVAQKKDEPKKEEQKKSSFCPTCGEPVDDDRECRGEDGVKEHRRKECRAGDERKTPYHEREEGRSERVCGDGIAVLGDGDNVGRLRIGLEPDILKRFEYGA